ncbi:hypothetical protein [Caballeronia sp. LZ035]|uniref:hypothetical protein n=1 Tax=Caballeronia sp. LZ035 TaxID=3038568 RepID=UPI0028635785|nr:hypothetical protein [Caballeronia sp. LZ035]MDR5757888.1 hypothetical protein [Caballeronia sp. LZ035]
MKSTTTDTEKTAHERMLDATARFIRRLDTVPGWKEARIANMVAAMDFEDPIGEGKPIPLPTDIELQHDVVTRFLELYDLVLAFKTCEYYFRRFPFRGLPVTRHEHLSNVCELYFNRIYQFKERLKYLVDAVDASVPKHGIQFGPFIKRFAKEFDQEIRERNQIHHFVKFADLDIHRVFLAGFNEIAFPNKGWKEEERLYYGKVTRAWIRRVRNRATRLDAFLEAVAEALLVGCPFLNEPQGGD